MEIPYTVKPRPDTGLYNAKIGIWLFLASEVMLFGALFSAYILLRLGAPTGTWPDVINAWPHGLLDVKWGMINTLVLITSSVTVVLAWAALKMNQFGRYKMYQSITIICALIFMVIKSVEYHDKFTHYYVKYEDNGQIKEITGHIEGRPAFWTKKTLTEKQIAEIKFTPDAPKGDHGAAHAEHPPAITIKAEQIQSLKSFGPWLNTYLAIYFTLTALHGLHVIGGALVIFMIWGPLAKMWKTEPERYTNRVEVSGLFWHFVDLVWIFLFPVFYLL